MVEYNPFSDDVMRDPHPVYRRLRDEAPAYYIEAYDAWALSRFEDIWNCSMDAEHFSAAAGTTSAHLLTKVQPVTPMLNMMDPPEHTELRARLRPFFLPGRAAKLGPQRTPPALGFELFTTTMPVAERPSKVTEVSGVVVK